MATKTILRTETKKEIGLLASRAFLYLWIGQVVSLIGDHVYAVGLTWSATQINGLLGSTSLGIAIALPLALLGIFAGAIVDQSDRFTLLIATDAVRAGIVALITLVLLLAPTNFLLICLGALILGVASLLFTPALQAILPELGGNDRDTLLRMDSWTLGTISTLGVVGPAIAGVFLTWFSPTWLVAFDALSFVFSAVMLFRMRAEMLKTSSGAIEPRPARKNILSNAKDGLKFLYKHPVLRPQFSVFPFMESVSFAIPFLLPVFVHTFFQAAGILYGLLLGLWAGGRVLGMMVISRTRLKAYRGRILMLNFLLQGAALLLFVLVPVIWVAPVAFLCLGIPAGASQIALSSYIQLEIPPQMRGRVFAALTSLVTWLRPLGPLALGALAEWKGIQAAFLTIGIFFVLGGAYICAHRAVREVK